MDTSAAFAHFGDQPFAQHMGLLFDHAEPGYARLRLPTKPHHMTPGGVVQGGVLVVLADAAFAQALRPMLKDGESATTVELKVNYLSPARLGEELIGEGRIVQRGSRIAVGDMEVRDAASGRIVLKGLGTFMVMRARGG